jgi:hypothetical protein
MSDAVNAINTTTTADNLPQEGIAATSLEQQNPFGLLPEGFVSKSNSNPTV